LSSNLIQDQLWRLKDESITMTIKTWSYFFGVAGTILCGNWAGLPL
jgi:hypothetical protein